MTKPAYSLPYSAPSIICISILEWIKDSTKFDLNLNLEALRSRNLMFHIDNSNFPKNPILITAHIILTSKKIKLGTANFISSTVPLFRNNYTTKICRVLTIIKLVSYLLSCLLPLKLSNLLILISSDCSVVINFILGSPITISFSSTIH